MLFFAHEQYIIIIVLYKNCKTFNQNLPIHVNNEDVSNGTMKHCNNNILDTTGCKVTFNPSNKKYQVLEHKKESPQLPFGYPAAMLLALVPPMWFRVMNSRIPPQMLPDGSI